ncbi:MAG: alkaline phosphatase PhoX [Phycisphaerales bacterium]
MPHDRRQFMQRGAAFALGFTGLRSLLAHAGSPAHALSLTGYGPLVPDPAKLLDLPAGFEYVVLSRTGEEMDDGLLVPGQHDGMAAFPGKDGRVLLVRNHEVHMGIEGRGAFGPADERLAKIPSGHLYDPGAAKGPSRGGTTTLVYDPATRKLEKHFLSLAGTEYNCAGGPTPWGTWLTCEETVSVTSENFARDHGFVFEVTPSETPGLADPVPLTAMGRFRHEAVAVDPASGCVYLTEDVAGGALYRFIPTVPGRLALGGRLQALAVNDRWSLDTKNWEPPSAIPVGSRFPVRWIDLEDVLSPKDTLRIQAAEKGAATFARCEGMWFGRGSVYFAATTGGAAKLGQIWKYTMSPHEAKPAEAAIPAVLELFIEPNDSKVCNNADNLTVAPWGDLIVCEDGPDLNGLFGVTPAAEAYRLAYNRQNKSELAGAAFSPDGTVLFVNVQSPGMTFAIHGPWRKA